MKTGEELYQIYVQYHADHNCSVDEWDELDARDQGAWNAVAAAVQS